MRLVRMRKRNLIKTMEMLDAELTKNGEVLGLSQEERWNFIARVLVNPATGSPEALARHLAEHSEEGALSEQRLSLTPNGNVRYQLKTPYRDGTTHVIFEPLDFIARLAALVPKPRVNLTRFHGVFAPNSKHRALVTPAKRGRGNQVRVVEERPSPAERRASMTWAQRLKRVFNIDIETCSVCGGAMKVIACIEDPVVIKQILDHLGR